MGAEMRIPGERPAMNPIASDDLLNHVRASFVLWDATGFSVVESFPYSVEDFRVMAKQIPQDGGRPTEGSPDQPPPKAR